jgi:hypothetical protein
VNMMGTMPNMANMSGNKPQMAGMVATQVEQQAQLRGRRL